MGMTTAWVRHGARAAFLDTQAGAEPPPIYWLRYNPDEWRVDGAAVAAWKDYSRTAVRRGGGGEERVVFLARIRPPGGNTVHLGTFSAERFGTLVELAGRGLLDGNDHVSVDGVCSLSVLHDECGRSLAAKKSS